MPETPKSDGLCEKKVWFVTGRKENKAFREFVPPRFLREEAHLSDDKENPPKKNDDEKEGPQHHESQKAG